MPRGDTHDWVSLTLAKLILVGALIGGVMGWVDVRLDKLSVFCLAFVFTALWLSPDLDLSRCNARRRWGPLGFLWEPYAWLSSHRGLSHHWLLGPLTLGLYLLWITSPVWLATREWWWPWLATWLPSRWGALIAGVYAAHWLHLRLDRLKP